MNVIDVVDGKLKSYSLKFPSHLGSNTFFYSRLDHQTWIRTANQTIADEAELLQLYRVVDQKVTFVSEWPFRTLDQPELLFVTDGSTIGTAHPVEDVFEHRDFSGRLVNQIPFPSEFRSKNGNPIWRWRGDYWESPNAKVLWDPMTLERLEIPWSSPELITRHAPSRTSAVHPIGQTRIFIFDESTSTVIHELPLEQVASWYPSGKLGIIVLESDDPLRFETYDLSTRTHQVIDWRWKRSLWMGLAIGSYVLWCLGWIALSSAFRFPFLLDIAVMNLALLLSLRFRHDAIGVSWLEDEGESWLMITIHLLAFSWMSVSACWFVFGPWRKLQKLNIWLASLGVGFLVLDWTLMNDTEIGSIRAELFTSVLVSTIVSIFFFLFLRIFYNRLQKENSVAEMGDPDPVKHARRPLSLSDMFVLLAVVAVCIRNYRVSEKWLWPLPDLDAFAVMFAVGVAVSLHIFALVQARNRILGSLLVGLLTLAFLVLNILFPESPDSVYSGRLMLAFLNTWVVLAPFLVMRWHGWRLVRRADGTWNVPATFEATSAP